MSYIDAAVKYYWSYSWTKEELLPSNTDLTTTMKTMLGRLKEGEQFAVMTPVNKPTELWVGCQKNGLKKHSFTEKSAIEGLFLGLTDKPLNI